MFGAAAEGGRPAHCIGSCPENIGVLQSERGNKLGERSDLWSLRSPSSELKKRRRNVVETLFLKLGEGLDRVETSGDPASGTTERSRRYILRRVNIVASGMNLSFLEREDVKRGGSARSEEDKRKRRLPSKAEETRRRYGVCDAKRVGGRGTTEIL